MHLVRESGDNVLGVLIISHMQSIVILNSNCLLTYEDGSKMMNKQHTKMHHRGCGFPKRSRIF
jgi:hypothetical protein